MNLSESLRIALTGLLTNRLRSILTTLGIIIGVGAVIALVSLGRGVEDFIASEFQALGSNVLFVFSSTPTGGITTEVEPLTTVEAADLATPSIAPSVAEIAQEFVLPALVVGSEGASQLGVGGVTPNYDEVRNWTLRAGSFITDRDEDTAARVAVLGTTIVERLFGDKALNPLGESIRINDRVFTIVGVLEERSSSGLGILGDENEVVFIPISTAQTRMATNTRTRDGGYQVDVLHIQAVSETAMDNATSEIEAYLLEAHNIEFQGAQDFTILNQRDLITSLGQITGVLTVFLSMIAGISLLVGGIGIMNIMLVSVTERTREIGLRKAVGARGGDILMQFLIESLVLSIAGGALGVVFGWAATQLAMVLIPNLTLVITLDAILLATLVSSLIGVFFGLYPASRPRVCAAIQALRFE